MSENSPIDQAECENIADLMQRKYSGYLDGKIFSAEVKSDSEGVYATVTLKNRPQTFVYPVKGRLKHADQGLKPKEAALLLLDYIDLYFEEYLKENGEVLLPIDWADYTSDEIHLQLKGQILNEELERMGDNWLSGRTNEELH